jgi:hypothetical protein
MLKKIVIITIMCLSLAACKSSEGQESIMDVKTMDLSGYSSDKPAEPVHLLFIHHSCGGQLLAGKGAQVGDNCIYATHPNGGGLRKLLQENNYIVHEASYGSLIGDKTDICHWNAKFRDHMDKILVCRNQDEFFDDGTHNSIVVFKSCFPNNWIESDGALPGDPDSCEKTLANAQAAYRALLAYFSSHPETLFVAVTAPPMAEPVLYKKDKAIQLMKIMIGRPDTIEKVGKRARFFNNWLKDIDNGWLKDYELNNVAVFDYYDILTGYGRSDWSLHPTGGGHDSHPSSEGNAAAASEFNLFLNKSYNKMNMR